jgi:hypothetical protein
MEVFGEEGMMAIIHEVKSLAGTRPYWTRVMRPDDRIDNLHEGIMSCTECMDEDKIIDSRHLKSLGFVNMLSYVSEG